MTAERAKRKLTAILSADVKEYSHLMCENEEAAFHTVNRALPKLVWTQY